MMRNRGIRISIAVALIAMLMSGCSLVGGKKSGSDIDPPQGQDAIADPASETMASANTADEEQTGKTNQQGQENMKTTLYAADENGMVAPITIEIPQSIATARKSLEYMVADGPGEKLLPQGFRELLPAGTAVNGISIVQDKKLAIVDFSKEFLNYDKKDERKILEAVTWTLTGFPTIQQVQLTVNGTTLNEMPAAKTPLDEPLSRLMGINVERAEGVDFSDAAAVTVYFLGQNKDKVQYFVPVTRLIKRTDELAKAVINELINGPSTADKLDSVMIPGTQLRDVQTSDNLVTVDFTDTILGGNTKAPAEALQSVVLSLTETTGAKQVQIMVNGSVKVNGTDNRSYSNPVTRPADLNPYQL